MAKILIVDDEFLTAMAFAEFLSENGYSIVGPFANEQDALDALANETPDAAFLDINLGPGQTSEKIATQLTNSSTPFAFLTGYSECPPIMAEFTDATYLAKPVSEKQAIMELENMIAATAR